MAFKMVNFIIVILKEGPYLKEIHLKLRQIETRIELKWD